MNYNLLIIILLYIDKCEALWQLCTYMYVYMHTTTFAHNWHNYTITLTMHVQTSKEAEEMCAWRECKVIRQVLLRWWHAGVAVEDA